MKIIAFEAIMERQAANNLLIAASKRRQIPLNKQTQTMVEVHIGHLIEYRSEEQPWRGILPGREKWEKTYQIETVALPRPATGTVLVGVTCSTCGCTVTVRVHSRLTVCLFYLAVGVFAAVSALLCYLLWRDSSYASIAALAVLYLAFYLELWSDIDHHSAVSLVRECQDKHQLWRPGEL